MVAIADEDDATRQAVGCSMGEWLFVLGVEDADRGWVAIRHQDTEGLPKHGASFSGFYEDGCGRLGRDWPSRESTRFLRHVAEAPMNRLLIDRASKEGHSVAAGHNSPISVQEGRRWHGEAGDH